MNKNINLTNTKTLLDKLTRQDQDVALKLAQFPEMAKYLMTNIKKCIRATNNMSADDRFKKDIRVEVKELTMEDGFPAHMALFQKVTNHIIDHLETNITNSINITNLLKGSSELTVELEDDE